MSNDVKKRILSESLPLMLNYGVKAMTMDELAKRIGISKRTIYEHFEDKDTLLTEILQYNKKLKEQQFKKVLEESSNVIHAFFHLLTNTESSTFTKMVSRHEEIKRYHPAVYQKIVCSDENQEIERVEKLFKLGVKQGVFRKNLKTDIAASLFRTILFQLWNDENKLREQYAFEKIFRSFIEIFIRGCCTEKGLDVIETIQKEKVKG
jgi:AcrR family transcriptional regulator